jgi:hypothetical protein
MDPGLLTLGAISVGAALLPKFLKSRKEGFDVIPTAGYPEVVNTGQELFNKLTLASDPRSEAVRLDNLPEVTQDAYKRAVDNITATTETTLTPQGVFNAQGNTQTPVYLPNDDSILNRIAFCQNSAISNSVFQNEQFKRDCGVCVSKGNTSDNKSFTGMKGLFILPEMKEQAIQMATAAGQPYTSAKPTYGFCEGATGGADHNFTFALNEKEYNLFRQRVGCQHTKQLDGKCATCLKDGKYTFVGNTDRSLDPITFIIFAKNAIIDASLGGTKPDFQYPNNVQTFVASGQNSSRFSIVLTEGAFLNFNVSGYSGRTDRERGPIANKQVVAEFWGLMEFTNATGGVERIPLDRILLKDDATGGPPRYAKDFAQINGIFCRKMIKRSGQESMMLNGQVPFLLVNNAPFEGIDCKGSLLQTLGSSVEKFGGDPCYRPSTQGPGTWTDACLRDRIQTLGCTTNGQLFQNPGELRNLSMTDIIQRIQQHVSRQYSENSDSMKCNGRNISTPCDPYVNFDAEETPELSNQCIEFLYYNRGADKPHIGPTYTGPTDKYYSLDSTGKRIMCLPGGRMDPARGDHGLLNLLKSSYRNGGAGAGPGLQAVKNIMNGNYNRALNTGLNANLPDSRGGRKDAIERCFVTLANIPDNVLPDKKLPNARYCRVRYPPGVAQCIQISQIAVFDNRDQNVAFGKPVRASSVWANGRDGAVPEKAVDGVLAARRHPNQFHNQCRANEFWMVDLTKTYPIKRVEYYNRADCCWDRANGMLLELLDEKQTVVWSQTLDGNWKQVYYTFLKNFNV